MTDIEALAKTIYGESRGEPPEGQIAVGFTVLNRLALNTWYGHSIEEVCLKPYQYSCWLKSDPNRSKMDSLSVDSDELQSFVDIAYQIINTQIDDPSLGATHYYAVYINPPAWISQATFTVQIGQHRFYKDVK